MNSCFNQKGTIVEKITEETLRDWSHLKELLSICEGNTIDEVITEWSCIFMLFFLLLDGLIFLCYLYITAAQRRIGETSLNERSSRSHQIIKLVSLIPLLHIWVK